MELTPEMEAWLASNRLLFEDYILRRALHDVEWRASLLTVIKPEDFLSMEMACLAGALGDALYVARVLGIDLPAPLTVPYLQSYIAAYGRKHVQDVTKEEAELALSRSGDMLLNPWPEVWEFCPVYLERWLTNSRASRYSRAYNTYEMQDASILSRKIESDLVQVRSIVGGEDMDEMALFSAGGVEDFKSRRSTGIPALNKALRGGWANGECYLFFSGTGGGKSIIAGQVSANEVQTNGYPLVVSTELTTAAYLTRIISCTCSIDIDLIGDCLSTDALLSLVSQKKPAQVDQVQRAIQTIMSRLVVIYVPPNQEGTVRETLEWALGRFRAIWKQRGYDIPKPTLLVYDWIGDAADKGLREGAGSAERSKKWEDAGSEVDNLCRAQDIPIVALTQAVNGAEHFPYLTLKEIGVGKGLAKKFTAAIGITNLIDKEALKEEMSENPNAKAVTLDEQKFCLCKARIGKQMAIPVKREFHFQRFSMLAR